MPDTNHTPTPWHLAEDETSLYFVDTRLELGEIEDGQEHPAHDTTICDCAVDEHGPIDPVANARFILQAVNSHDELLAALVIAEGLLTKVEVRRYWNEKYNASMAESFDFVKNNPPEYLVDIRNVIAKAKAPHNDHCEFCTQLEKLKASQC